MKKRILAILVILCMISMPLQKAEAATNATVSVSTGDVTQGGTTEVSVLISGNPGIAAWMFTVSWDLTALSLEIPDSGAAEAGDVFASGTLLAKQTDTGLTVSWFSVNNVNSDGELFRFRLKASDSAAGTYAITVDYSEKNTIDVREQPVALKTETASVEVTSTGTQAPGVSGSPSDQPAEDNNSAGSEKPGGASQPASPAEGGGDVGSSGNNTSPDQTNAPENDANDPGNNPDEGATSPSETAQTPSTGGNPFSDVSAGAYYHDAVLWAVRRGITTGTAPTAFSPETTCTRAQMVTFLWRAAGSPDPVVMGGSFADVKSGSYYYKAVQWAAENGITSGTSENTFSPEDAVTRAQVVTFLWRASGNQRADGANPFVDVPADEYYSNAVQWAVESGITSGTSANTFSPATGCTRGQIVTFLYRDHNKGE